MDKFATAELIEFANLLSRRMESETDALAKVFHAICHELERRGVVVSDYVVYPNL